MRRRKRFSTVELITEESGWTPPEKPTVFGLRVELKEADLQRRVKQAGTVDAPRETDMGVLVPQRKIIVNIATSADGYVARPDGNLDWLTERPAPKGFYGLPEFERSVDAKILGRKTFDRSLQMGARLSAGAVHHVFSRRSPPASVPAGVHFVTESIAAFAERLRTQAGKNVWMM